MRLKIKDLEEKLSNTMQKCEEEVSLSRRNPSFFFFIKRADDYLPPIP